MASESDIIEYLKGIFDKAGEAREASSDEETWWLKRPGKKVSSSSEVGSEVPASPSSSESPGKVSKGNKPATPSDGSISTTSKEDESFPSFGPFHSGGKKGSNVSKGKKVSPSWIRGNLDTSSFKKMFSKGVNTNSDEGTKVTSPVTLSTGEVIATDTWNSLSKSSQDLLMKLGIDGYNKEVTRLQEERKQQEEQAVKLSETRSSSGYYISGQDRIDAEAKLASIQDQMNSLSKVSGEAWDKGDDQAYADAMAQYEALRQEYDNLSAALSVTNWDTENGKVEAENINSILSSDLSYIPAIQGTKIVGSNDYLKYSTVDLGKAISSGVSNDELLKLGFSQSDIDTQNSWSKINKVLPDFNPSNPAAISLAIQSGLEGDLKNIGLTDDQLYQASSWQTLVDQGYLDPSTGHWDPEGAIKAGLDAQVYSIIKEGDDPASISKALTVIADISRANEVIGKLGGEDNLSSLAIAKALTDGTITTSDLSILGIKEGDENWNKIAESFRDINVPKIYQAKMQQAGIDPNDIASVSKAVKLGIVPADSLPLMYSDESVKEILSYKEPETVRVKEEAPAGYEVQTNPVTGEKRTVPIAAPVMTASEIKAAERTSTELEEMEKAFMRGDLNNTPPVVYNMDEGITTYTSYNIHTGEKVVRTEKGVPHLMTDVKGNNYIDGKPVTAEEFKKEEEKVDKFGKGAAVALAVGAGTAALLATAGLAAPALATASTAGAASMTGLVSGMSVARTAGAIGAVTAGSGGISALLGASGPSYSSDSKVYAEANGGKYDYSSKSLSELVSAGIVRARGYDADTDTFLSDNPSFSIDFDGLSKEYGETGATAIVASLGKNPYIASSYKPTIDKNAYLLLEEETRKLYSPSSSTSIYQQTGLLGSVARGSKKVWEPLVSKLEKIGGFGPGLLQGTLQYSGLTAPYEATRMYDTYGKNSLWTMTPIIGSTGIQPFVTNASAGQKVLGVTLAVLPFVAGPMSDVLGKIKVPKVIRKASSTPIGKVLGKASRGVSKVALKTTEAVAYPYTKLGSVLPGMAPLESGLTTLFPKGKAWGWYTTSSPSFPIPSPIKTSLAKGKVKEYLKTTKEYKGEANDNSLFGGTTSSGGGGSGPGIKPTRPGKGPTKGPSTPFEPIAGTTNDSGVKVNYPARGTPQGDAWEKIFGSKPSVNLSTSEPVGVATTVVEGEYKPAGVIPTRKDLLWGRVYDPSMDPALSNVIAEEVNATLGKEGFGAKVTGATTKGGDGLLGGSLFPSYNSLFPGERIAVSSPISTQGLGAGFVSLGGSLEEAASRAADSGPLAFGSMAMGATYAPTVKKKKKEVKRLYTVATPTTYPVTSPQEEEEEYTEKYIPSSLVTSSPVVKEGLGVKTSPFVIPGSVEEPTPTLYSNSSLYSQPMTLTNPEINVNPEEEEEEDVRVGINPNPNRISTSTKIREVEPIDLSSSISGGLGGGGFRGGKKKLLRGRRWLSPALVVTFRNPLTMSTTRYNLSSRGSMKYGVSEVRGSGLWK